MYVGKQDGSGTPGAETAVLEALGNGTIYLGVYLLNPAVVSGGSGKIFVQPDGKVVGDGGVYGFAHAPQAEALLKIEQGGSYILTGETTIQAGSGNNTSSVFDISGVMNVGNNTFHLGTAEGAANAQTDENIGEFSPGNGQIFVRPTGSFTNTNVLRMGIDRLNRTASAGTGTGTGSAEFEGTVNLNRIELGIDGGDGTLEVKGGTTTLTAGIDFGNGVAAADGQPSEGRVTVSGGTLALGGDLVTGVADSGNSTLTLSGGTLDMGSGTIRADVINIESGTLRDPGSIQDGGGAAASITKTGGGTLVIDGDASYAGPTAITSGTAVIDADLTQSDVSISAGATLMGSGSIEGDLQVAGTHAPGNSVGTQSVSGTLAYTATSKFVWELNSNSDAAGSADRMLTFGGNPVTIASGATIDLVLNSAGSSVDFSDPFWNNTRRWTVVSSADVTGTFAQGAVTTDSAGGNAASVGGFSVEVTSAGVELVWNNNTPPIEFWRAEEFGPTPATRRLPATPSTSTATTLATS